MTEISGRADIALDVNNFVSRFWDDMEKGRSLYDLLAEEAVYDVKQLRLEGREAIVAFEEKRVAAIKSVSRHLMNNLYFDFSVWADDQRVTVRGIMTFFGGVGEGVLPVELPMSIYDFSFEVRRGGVHGWLMVNALFDPIFVKQDEAITKYTGGQLSSS